MRHDLRAEGYAFRLRPVTLADASFIVELRTEDVERTKFLHRISSDVARQEEWLASYFERANEYYWVVEKGSNEEREGLVSIYSVDLNARSGEWGRWVLCPNSLAAVESALLVYRTAFEVLGLDLLRCLTVADNLSVVSFHETSGLRPTGQATTELADEGRRLRLVEHVCERQDWPKVRLKLEPVARAIALRLGRSP